nr:helix-turn-helix transcriptional regulator [Bacillus sp. JCM 19034]
MKRIKLINERKKRQLTREELGSILGISAIYVRKIENGDRNPGRRTMVKFAEFYGVSERKLFPELFDVR